MVPTYIYIYIYIYIRLFIKVYLKRRNIFMIFCFVFCFRFLVSVLESVLNNKEFGLVFTPKLHETSDYIWRHFLAYYGCDIYFYLKHGLNSRVFVNCPGDRGFIPGWVIPKTQKMVLDTALLSTQYHEVRTKGKVEQSWELSSALPYTTV